MDLHSDEFCIRWILEEFTLSAHISEKILIIPFSDHREEWMISHMCLDQDMLLEFLRIVDRMKEFFLHPIVWNRQI